MCVSGRVLAVFAWEEPMGVAAIWMIQDLHVGPPHRYVKHRVGANGRGAVFECQGVIVYGLKSMDSIPGNHYQDLPTGGFNTGLVTRTCHQETPVESGAGSCLL